MTDTKLCGTINHKLSKPPQKISQTTANKYSARNMFRCVRNLEDFFEVFDFLWSHCSNKTVWEKFSVSLYLKTTFGKTGGEVVQTWPRPRLINDPQVWAGNSSNTLETDG